ncbi:AT-hook motif nuclear-localized protein 5 [Abeliophyllum distichum]|uniref:AT-hook motif nuclear-localized protein n=1 Tax=Abeliophyllum distichum TaxID=126358 RepID=A0ABD1TXF5_9LAMI
MEGKGWKYPVQLHITSIEEVLVGSGTGPNAPAGGGLRAPQTGGFHTPPGFKTSSVPNFSLQSNAGASGGSVSGSTFHVENPSPNFPHAISTAAASSMSPVTDTGKKKRGRPRKYGPDGANMSLALSPLSTSTPSSGAITLGEKPRRGRPPGSGWKQKLAPLGEWMNSSAGLAFTPHVLHIGIEEDIAAKVLAFAQQRPRALCILSANGSVSTVTLRQPTSGGTVTYEGRFEILCLSGSYLVAEGGGPRNRTGGISISVCSPDGHIFGGAIGGRLIAASPVQVVVCSFVYGGSKEKSITEFELKDENNQADQSFEKSLTPVSAAAGQNFASNSATGIWPSGSRPDVKNPQSDIDLMRG